MINIYWNVGEREAENISKHRIEFRIEVHLHCLYTHGVAPMRESCNQIVAKYFFSFFFGLVQERRNSSALAMELRISCTNPSIWSSFDMEMHISHGGGVAFYVVSLNIAHHISRSNYSFHSIILSLNIVKHIFRSSYSYLLWQIVNYHGILVGTKHLYWNALCVVA